MSSALEPELTSGSEMRISANAEVEVMDRLLAGHPVLVDEHPTGYGVIQAVMGKVGLEYRVVDRRTGDDVIAHVDTHVDRSRHVLQALDRHVRPWHATWMPRGFNGSDEGKTIRVMAVGATARDAVLALGDSLGNAKEEIVLDVESVAEANGEWEARATFDGTGMRIGGMIVPGGYVVTDWS